MASLVWLLIPLAGAIYAASWASWAARRSAERGTGDAAGVAGYDAFRSVMERSAAERHRRSGAAGGGAPSPSTPLRPARRSPPRTARPERPGDRPVP
ncbi:hypothetical protein GCM10023347_31240 [Streptomyces chumphonensis]|uniref:Uncharacterized protein n=1 Tax=Streptomyces chumphonensis TaxID=1214925 RepID=A0A927F1Z2_9ACTN|nr:hypothetical protein [Streptomyces chumphonensis]MBD3933761.1 hypothetical protein [Streptomyces chumphonensis]